MYHRIAGVDSDQRREIGVEDTQTALRQMIALITGRTILSRQEAYQFRLLAVDFHVTQSVNGEKGIHALLKKGLLF